MKTSLIILALILSCTSDPEKRKQRQEWDSGAARENAFQEETIKQRDSNIKDQNPSVIPNTNQSPSQ